MTVHPQNAPAPLRCLVLDDEPLALQLIESYFSKLPELAPFGFLTDPQLAVEVMLNHSIDLLFLDIEMPDVNGLKFFAKLPYQPMVIFSTAHRQYALEGFELQAIDYLLKPYEFKRFERAVKKAVDYHVFNSSQHWQPQRFLFVRSEYALVKIDLLDLYLVETAEDYLKLHLLSQKRPVFTLMTLTDMAQLLPEHEFLRVHRSYIIATRAVEKIMRRGIQIKDQIIPVGSTYLEKVKKVLRI